MRRPVSIAPPKGKLGVLTPGMGAVSTTVMAGVELVRQGHSVPVGSLTQMGTIRLGRRTEARVPKISEFVKLAGLKDLVFGGWDIYPDSAFQAATKAGVLDSKDLAKAEKFLKTIKPMKAAFDQNYVKNLSGTNVKKGKNKFDLAEQIRDDIRAFKKKNKLDRMVMESSSSNTGDGPVSLLIPHWRKNSSSDTDTSRRDHAHNLHVGSARSVAV